MNTNVFLLDDVFEGRLSSFTLNFYRNMSVMLVLNDTVCLMECFIGGGPRWSVWGALL